MRKIYAILSLTLMCSASSFAIDQVTLTTGEMIEGKVLSDVPNRHVDIELTNGQKRRYPHSQVLTVERDVPSNKDRTMFGVDRRFFVGPIAGGIIATGGGDVQFTYGLKIGANAGNMGGAFFAPTLLYKRFSQSAGTLASSDTNFIEGQFLFRRIGGSGFYIGPQLGLGLQSVTILGVSGSATAFMGGAATGYDLQFSDSFSIGPELQYEHSFASGGSNFFTFGMSILFHFE